jgi:anti-sigma regulatory factor (Ser/Thr protein kinase)
LVRYNPKDNSFQRFLSNPEDSTSIGSNLINSILEDRSGVFWVAGHGGIDRLNRETGRFNHYLAGTYIGYLYEDSGGTLWAGTDRGLYRYNQKEDRFTGFFDPQAEINSFTIGGIIEDNAKNLWLTSPSAIIRVNTSTKELFIYGSRFGISPNSLLEWAAPYKDRKGQLFIGGPKGFYTFSPEELAVKTDLKLIITDLFINTIPVLTGKRSPIQKPVEEISDLELKYNQNNIAFNFATIDYRNPEATKYFTMLESYDNTWREVAGEKSSNYFLVPPGKYVFRIKAYNSDGVKAEKTITIRIYPAWWNTWLFRISAIIFIGVIFYGLLRWRLKQKFRLQLERSEKERQMAELKQKGTELEMQALRAQMNPHFIFNSLNSINRFILQNNRAQASEYLTKFSKLIRLILQNSQASLIPLDSELESLELYLNLEALRFNYHFSYKISVPKDMDISALQVPPLILQPYVENAIWHGLMHKEEKGQLDVEISEEDDYLYFKITDNGIGREKASALASKSATKHKAMGLRITAHRIAILQKSQTLESPVSINDLVNTDGSAAGTEVTIKMPVIYD